MFVPDENGPWEPICWFALSYNGYERYGTQPGDIQGEMSLGSFANQTHSRWRRNKVLPDSLHELRSALFYEQRRSGKGFAFTFDVWTDWDDPNSDYQEWFEYVKSLIRAIRALAGDYIDMPPDLEKPDDNVEPRYA